MEKHSDEYKEEYYRNGEFFQNCMTHYMSAFHMPSLMTAMNQLSNHDHSRFLTRTNKVAGRLATKGAEAASKGIERGIMGMAVAFQMTWIGAPTLYYGDEAGVCGFTDPDNRRTYPWGKEDFQMIEFHRDMIAIHKRNPVLKTGSTKIMMAEGNTLAFARFDENDQMITVLNMSDEEKTIKLPVWSANMPMECQVERQMKTTVEWYNVGKKHYPVKDGILELRMDPMSSKVVKRV